MSTPQNFEPHTQRDAVILPFRRQMNDSELLAFSVMFAYCERPDAPENVQEAARTMREVLR